MPKHTPQCLPNLPVAPLLPTKEICLMMCLLPAFSLLPRFHALFCCSPQKPLHNKLLPLAFDQNHTSMFSNNISIPRSVKTGTKEEETFLQKLEPWRRNNQLWITPLQKQRKRVRNPMAFLLFPFSSLRGETTIGRNCHNVSHRGNLGNEVFCICEQSRGIIRNVSSTKQAGAGRKVLNSSQTTDCVAHN